MMLSDLNLLENQSHSISKPAGQTVVEASWRTILADPWPPGRRLTQAILGQSKIPPRTEEEGDLLMHELGLMARLEFHIAVDLYSQKMAVLD